MRVKKEGRKIILYRFLGYFMLDVRETVSYVCAHEMRPNKLIILGK